MLVGARPTVGDDCGTARRERPRLALPGWGYTFGCAVGACRVYLPDAMFAFQLLQTIAALCRCTPSVSFAPIICTRGAMSCKASSSAVEFVRQSKPMHGLYFLRRYLLGLTSNNACQGAPVVASAFRHIAYLQKLSGKASPVCRSHRHHRILKSCQRDAEALWSIRWKVLHLSRETTTTAG